MNLDPVRRVATSILYDGYRVYPARMQPTRRQRRWTFGSLYPRGFTSWTHHTMMYAQQAQCLVEGTEMATVEVCVRFLQAVERGSADWREAIEREVSVSAFILKDACVAPIREAFSFDGACDPGDRLVHAARGICGMVIVQAQRLGDECHRLTIRTENLSPFNPAQPWSDDVAALYALGAVHTVVSVRGGRLVSLIDPPAPHRQLAAQCVNRGCFPVLVGDRAARDTLLASPTILDDYPDTGHPRARTRDN